MKKLINEPRDVVVQMLEGLTAVYPGLQLLPGHPVVIRSDLPGREERPVALISGGGSGHEPAHGGYVGRGMLTAAVAGEVFTSPAPDSILAALRAAAGSLGVVQIVKSYTGDRLNFGLAAELARAEGIEVETVLVADDAALIGKVDRRERRGLAGTILVHKVAGAAAEAGRSLSDVAGLARSVAEGVRTMGVALSPCTVPAAGRPGFELGPNEIELGLGIHGEPGVRRIGLLPANDLVDHLLSSILTELPRKPGASVVLMVNNLGATPTMELAIVARQAVAVLEKLELVVERVYLGTFLSALEMAGVSLSVLPVNPELLALLDAPTEAPAWPRAAARHRSRSPVPHEVVSAAVTSAPSSSKQTTLGNWLRLGVAAALQAVIEASPRLTELDQAVGDGDLGISLERGARAVQAELPSLPWDDAPAVFHRIGTTLQRSLGGTSGPLYAVFFLRVAHVLRAGNPERPATWSEAMQAGCDAVAELGGAKAGDRTMLDALLPAASALRENLAAGKQLPASLESMAESAREGARATRGMVARRGRSSYLGERALGHPDPGAEAVALWLSPLPAVAAAHC